MKRTDASAAQQKEANSINTSLMQLWRCIQVDHTFMYKYIYFFIRILILMFMHTGDETKKTRYPL